MSELYAITVKKGGWLNTAPYVSKTQPIRIDKRFRESMESGISSEELYPILGERLKKEPSILIGPKELLIEMVDTLTEGSFIGCRTVTQITTDKTAKSLRRLVDEMPSPMIMAKGILKRLCRLGRESLLGVPLVNLSMEPGSVFWKESPDRGNVDGMFLQEYRKRLLAMASAGLIPEVDPDITLDSIARELIFNHLAEQASLSEYGSLDSMTTVLSEHQLHKELGHVLSVAA